MGTSSAWTPERRAKQAEVIRRSQPWAKSTGPRTEAGKAVSSRNADKGVHREEHRARFRWLRARRKLLHAEMALLAHRIAWDGVKPFGPPDQIARPWPRDAEAVAAYNETLRQLQLEVERLAGLLDPVE